MDDAERRSAKRSRFDQTEPEPKRVSRFDRRSRSPPARKSDSGRDRDRSPLSKPRDSATPDSTKPAVDPAAAAAAAAARIQAQLQARKGIQHVDVPPVRSAGTREGSVPANINGEMYISDGDFIKDIEVNDLRNRYLLTKGSTQKMVITPWLTHSSTVSIRETASVLLASPFMLYNLVRDTLAYRRHELFIDRFLFKDVTTRGSYYPDKSMATPANPPLYLHVTSTTKEGLEKAVAKIEEMMKQELPQLVDERRFRRRDQEQVERDEYGRRKWPEERIPINLEPVPGFNLRAQVVGHGGAYVKHIQQETGCRVQIKGRGSGYIEASTGRESDDDMYLHVAGPDPKMVEKAKELCEDLMENVKQQYEEFKSRPPRQYNGPRDYRDREREPRGGDSYHGRGYNNNNSNNNNHRDHHHGGHHDNSHHSSYTNSPAPGGGPSVAPPTPTAPAAATTDYAAQYAQYYGGAAATDPYAAAGAADPYAAYGGYQA
nr:hypothetical protein B1D1.50 [imported] - Neurospora crassa [Neurospora crassa]